MIEELERRIAHLLGWHTPTCLLTTDPRSVPFRMLYPECQAGPDKVAKVLTVLGWHRWVAR